MFTGPTFCGGGGGGGGGALRDGVDTGQRTFVECKTLNTDQSFLFTNCCTRELLSKILKLTLKQLRRVSV
jgi:hypothetical protein